MCGGAGSGSRVLEVTAVQWTACRRRQFASACATLLLIALSLIRVRGADPRGANAVAVEMGLQPPTAGVPTPVPKVDLRPTPPVRATSTGSNDLPAAQASSATGMGDATTSGTSGSRESNPLQNIKPVTLVRFNTTRGVVDVDVCRRILYEGFQTSFLIQIQCYRLRFFC